MIDIPDELIATQTEFNGEAGRAFVAALPGRAEEFLGRWGLRLDDRPAMYGMCALVLPVTADDGTPAVLKLQLLDEENAGEAAALQVWDGAGAARLLRDDAETGTILLERLSSDRQLSSTTSRSAVLVIAELLSRLTAAPAPPGMRRLADIAARMLEETPRAVRELRDPAERRLLEDCAAAVREVAAEPGDRLLHWDLHYENVLAADREPWLAIDPKPLAGDPGFELLPALVNRFDATEVRWRFDAMTEVLGLDRARARAWTLGRVLQNCLWEIEDGDGLEREHVEMFRLLRDW
ncbi:aminoglycoside phosphotransferase family protein [Streptomyces sp. BPTC-684]|uniref:aminoglycoside phosphotransferase family protein n=1 Tax=Streptomyces sp. BPTC-684 TaxID=3043734 RepID=UPI0024B1195A|nr:aminoglycoside phosphotransferase family protein [Streptomyces sp. BPTC-684]WHM38073.1 aminoglycoside phosphotransferase family protein [Streptomyces sp. BPTC-684]